MIWIFDSIIIYIVSVLVLKKALEKKFTDVLILSVILYIHYKIIIFVGV